MSPEQASGRARGSTRAPTSTASACVLYEMLAGEPPFPAPTAQAMIARRFIEAREPVRQLARHGAGARGAGSPEGAGADPGGPIRHARPSSPRRWSGAGVHGATRAPTAAATAAAPAPRPPAGAPRLRRAAAVAATRCARVPASDSVCCSPGAGAQATSDRATAARSALAVLPFENLGAPTTSISPTASPTRSAASWPRCRGSRSSRAAARASTRRPPRRPQEIARELGVDYLLTGTVRWEKGAGGPSRVRVSPELIAGHDRRRRKWQQPFDAALTDVFQVQADIAGRVAAGARRRARRERAARSSPSGRPRTWRPTTRT